MRCAVASACRVPAVGEVQARGAARQDLARRGRGAVADEEHQGRRRWLGSGGHQGSGRTYRVAVTSPVERRRHPALARLESEMVRCDACPRLVALRESVADEKRASFKDEAYWVDRWPASATRGRRWWCWPGAGGARRQPHRPHLHRRSLGRLAVRRAASRRLREPAHATPGRWPRAARLLLGDPACAALRPAPTTSPRPTSATRCVPRSSPRGAAPARPARAWS